MIKTGMGRRGQSIRQQLNSPRAYKRWPALTLKRPVACRAMKNTYYVNAKVDGTSKGFYVEASDFSAATDAAIEKARLAHRPDAEVQIRVVQLLSDEGTTAA